MKYEHKSFGQFGHDFSIEFSADEIEATRQKIIEEFFNLQPQNNPLSPSKPRHLIAKDLEASMKGLLRERLIKDAFAEILKQVPYKPAAPIQTQAHEVVFGQNYKFTAQFEVLPRIDFVNVSGVSFDLRQPHINEQALNQEVSRLLLPFGEVRATNPDHQIKLNNLVFIALDYILAGKVLSEFHVKRQLIHIGSKQYILRIEDQLKGMKVGEDKTFDYQMPEIFNVHALAGKKLQLQVKILEIKEIVLPPLSDEFIRKSFAGRPGAPSSLTEFKEFARKQLVNRLTHQNFLAAKKNVIKKLVDQNQFEVPMSLVAFQKRILIEKERKEANLKGKYNPPLPQSAKDQELTRTAADMIRANLLIKHLAEKNNISISYMDIENFITHTAEIFGTTADDIRNKLATKESQEQLHQAVLENKVMESLGLAS